MVILFAFGCFVVIFTSFGLPCYCWVVIILQIFVLVFCVLCDGLLWGYVACFG